MKQAESADTQPVPILIADDHPIFREGLREILEDEPRLRIAAECDDGETALEAIRALRPRIAVLDIEMPKLSGLDVAAAVQAERLPVGIIMLTIYDRMEIFNRAMDLGAQGYILKDCAPLDLVQAIEAVMRGDYFISSSLSGHVLRGRHNRDENADMRLGLSRLTLLERTVLRMVAENKSSVEIGEELHISPRTVETHRSNINHKLGLKGSFALVRFALEHKDKL